MVVNQFSSIKARLYAQICDASYQGLMEFASGELSLETTIPTDLTISPLESDDAESIKNHQYKVKTGILEKKQLAHDLQCLKIELSQKNIIIDNLKLQSITKVEELEEQLNDVKHQKQIVKKTFANQLKMLTEEMRLQQEKYNKEKLNLSAKLESLHNENSTLCNFVDEIKDTLTNLHLTEVEYQKLKSKQENSLSIRECASIKVYESLEQLNKEKIHLMSHIQASENKLVETEMANHQLKLIKILNTNFYNEQSILTSFSYAMLFIICEEDFNTALREKKEASIKHSQVTAELKKILENIDCGNYKIDNFDKIKRERDSLKAINFEVSNQLENLQGSYKVLIQGHDEYKSLVSTCQQKLDLCKNINKSLSKDLTEQKSRCDILEDRCSHLSLELDKMKQAREILYEKYIGNREQCKAEYQSKVEQEIGDLHMKTTQEIDRIQRSVRDMYERESRTLKDNLISAERAREYAVATEKESLSKYEQLLLEMKNLQSQDIGQISDLRSELKVKLFQLEQINKSQVECDRNLNDCKQENEKIKTKLDIMTQEVQRLQMTSSQRILLLESELSQKTRQLEIYEKLEDELDNLIVHAGQVASDGLQAERILASYGMTGVVSTTAKRRLEQSMQLAKKLLDAERKLTETESKLAKENLHAVKLSEELASAKELMSLTKQPDTYIVESLKQRDNIISSNKVLITSLEKKIDDLEKKCEKITYIKNEMSHDLEKLLSNREVCIMKFSFYVDYICNTLVTEEKCSLMSSKRTIKFSCVKHFSNYKKIEHFISKMYGI
ncbi:Progesterone-induced-blocking factor 1 [Nymphon striatum]|nr:Progesterone-induced-blocking factor 1 [Nymphon striatum]